jgi:hypothetical protein
LVALRVEDAKKKRINEGKKESQEGKEGKE